jgi:hypothetical protein
MKLTKDDWLQIAGQIVCNVRVDRNAGVWSRRIAAWLLMATLAAVAAAQAVSTTTVQGTVYLANGQPGAGTLVLSWPAFTTAAGQAIAADSTTVTIATDGFVSVNLAANLGATPAGEFYTAVLYMSDGSVNTQYWVVPAASSASLAQVQAQVMPAAQAVQAVSKSYVDEAIAELEGSLLTASGGTLTGPLYLNADPTQPMQAATKHYVDTQVATAVPLAGGNMTGALNTPVVNGVEAPATGSGLTTLQSAINAAGTNGAMEIPPNYTGTDTFTNTNGVKVTDLRTTGAQQTERSVKEFGAVCDGATDDTNALQAALNYANAHGLALTIPEGTCKTRSLNWRGESIGGLGKQVSALMGFPGQDVLASAPDATNILSYTRLHDLTIYVDQSEDASCSPAEGRAAAGACQMSRPIEKNSIFSPGGNGLTNTAGTGAGWWVGNCAIAMPANTGAGGNGLKVAELENLEIVTTGVDPMAALYPGAHSTHTCGLYLAQWPQWSEFRNIDLSGLNTAVAIPALPVATPAGLNADSSRWQNVTIQATHGFAAAAGSNNVLDNVVMLAGNSAAMGEPPTGIVLDLGGGAQGWTVRNAVVMPTWMAIPPALTVTAAGGAVTAVTVGSEHGLGWDPYGTQIPVSFSGSCSAQAMAAVATNGSITGVTVISGGVGCSSTTTASVNAAGTWDTAAPVNVVGGKNMSFFAGNLLRGSGGYTVWNATNSSSYGTQVGSGGGTLPGGGSYASLMTNGALGATYQVDQFPGADFGAKLESCISQINATYGGTCDARNFMGNQSMESSVAISTSNTAVLLPCSTIATSSQIVVTAGTRNVSLRGCAMRGGSAANGSQGGTAFSYSGAGAMVQVGDPTYALDTPGFHMDNAVINTTGATAATAQGLIAYRTQEIDLEDLYFLGNANQTGMTLDGTGNCTGGTFRGNQFDGFQIAVNAIGHQVANPATTDWVNASTFIRLHIDCPTSGGAPISGTYGINLLQGDGNTFTGGDVEGCATALHLGANAQNNTIVGLRNENSTNQVTADTGSSYNNWMTGGTMFTGRLTDNGTRNSFLDTFHRSFNGLTGDWYGSQQDATVTNHFRLGIGNGNERGLLNEVQTDYGYRWLYGFSDGTSGQQLYQLQDLLNNVYRLQIQQWNHGESSTNNQTALNAAGTGNVCFNCSTNSGTGGASFSSGGASPSTVATIDNSGDAQFNGTLQVAGTSQSTGTMTVRNNADAEVDYFLWPGVTTSQKGSYTYKDWNGNSQWYMVKDASNNWALNSAIGGLDSVKAYQSTNSGDTYLDTSNSTGHLRLNYEAGSGAETDIYSGSSSSLDAAFLGPTSIKFPGLAATSGPFCMQIDNSGYISNTGSACGTGSGGTSGTINSGTTGQIAYYTTSGTTVGGVSSVPVSSGGTGAATASAALANLGGVPLAGGTMTGALTTTQSIPENSPYTDIRAFGAVIDNATDIGPAVCSAEQSYSTSRQGQSATIFLPCGGTGTACWWKNPLATCTGVTGPGFKFVLQGKLNVGTTLMPPDATEFDGDAGQYGTQFQGTLASGIVNGPGCYGALGTAITATNTPVTITPTFSGTAGGSACSITNVPANAAITIRRMESSTASGSRVTSGSNGYVTLTTSTAIRISPGTNITVSGCSDSTFNSALNVAVNADYPNKQISYFTSTTGTGSATGCTVSGFSDDGFETALVQCSNGTGNAGYTCASGQLTFVPAHTYASTDQWGIVAMETPFNDGAAGTGLVMKRILVQGSPGAEFFADAGIHETFEDDGFAANADGLSVPFEADYVQNLTVHSSSFNTTNTGWGPCTGGSCPTVSYPFGFHCSAIPPSISPYQEGTCNLSKIDSFSQIRGGIKVDTNDFATTPFDAMAPELDRVLIEEPVWGGITFDTRKGVTGPVYAKDSYLQDFVLDNPDYAFIAATDPGGAPYIFENNTYLEDPNLVNKYWSGTSVDTKGNLNEQQNVPWPWEGAGSPGIFEDNGFIKAEYEGTGFIGLESVPFATISINQSPTYWQTQCSSSCTVTAVQDPTGGQNGASIASTSTSTHSVTVGTWTGATYAGDQFIFMDWLRPGNGETYPADWRGNLPFQLVTGGSDTFQNNACSGGIGSNTACADAYGLIMGNDDWAPFVTIATIGTGESTSHNISYILETGSNSSGTILSIGQESFCPQWAFVPGPNNPSYSGVSTFDVQLARMYNYHGCAPGGVSAGMAATSQGISAPSLTIQGASSGTYVKADGSGYGTPTSGITQLTGDVTAGPGSGSQAATVVKINGGSVPASASVLGTNSSSQPASAPTTGSGNVVLSASPTLTGTLAAATETLSGTLSVTGTQTLTGATTMQANVTLENGANSNQTLAIQPGTSADQTGAVQFNNYSGTSQWQLRKDASNYLRLTDIVNSLDRGVFFQNGNTMINAGAGSNAVVLNNTSGSGTGGFIVYEGGTNSSTAAFQVTASGNTTATGFLQGKFIMGNGTMSLSAGAAAGTSPSIACATSHVCDGVSGTVTLTTGTSPATGTLATLSFPNTHTNQANCMVSTLSSSGLVTTNSWTESTTAITLTANTALSASTAYTVKYWCGGN